MSPDPADKIGLERLRELSIAWAQKHFGEYQVAIVYHDDNEHRIPHAHIVVNNTNVETGKRLHVPQPKELNRDLQQMAASASWAISPPGHRSSTGGPKAARPELRSVSTKARPSAESSARAATAG